MSKKSVVKMQNNSNKSFRSSEEAGDLKALLEAAKIILEESDFAGTARKIFDAARDLTGAKSGYVALLSDNGEENELLFLESGGLPCDVDPNLPMPVRGLRAEAYKTGNAVVDNNFSRSRWTDYLPEGHVELKNVLFAPLNVDGKTVGIMGLANKDSNFTNNDLKMASAFADLAAISLKNSLNVESLQNFKTKLQDTMSVGNMAWWEMDLETGAVTFDDRKATMLGYRPDDFKRYVDFTELVHLEDYDRCMESMRNHLDGRSLRYDVEYRIKAKDGNYRWFHDVGGVSLRDDSGKPLKASGMVIDISKRKKTQEALEESERKFKFLAENTSDLIILLDGKGNFLYISPRIKQFTGYTADEYISLDTYQNIVEEDRMKVLSAMDQIAEGAESVSVRYRIRKKKGEPIWLETRSSVVRDQNGKPLYIITASSDVTESIRSAEKLNRQLFLMKALIHSIPGPVFYKDAYGKYLGCNKEFEKFLGIDKSEIIGKTVYDLAPKELADVYYEKDRELFDNPGDQIYESKIKYADGAIKDVMFYKSTFVDGSGKVAGLIGVMLDITARKNAERKQQSANRKLRILAECNIALIESQNQKELYFSFCETLANIGDYCYAKIYRVKFGSGEPVIEWQADSKSLLKECEELSIGETCEEKVLQAAIERRMIIDKITGNDAKKLISAHIPSISKSKHIDVIGVYSSKIDVFTDKERTLLKDIANYLAYGLDSLYDKSKRRKYEERLAYEKEKLSVTLQNIADGVVSCAKNGDVVFANNAACKILDLEEEDILKLKVFELFDAKNASGNDVMFNPFDSIQNRSGMDNVESKFGLTTLSGKSKMLSIKISGIWEAKTNFKGAVLIFNDITEQLKNEAQEALSQKMESIGRLAAGIAHEINTPLQFVGDNAYFLKDGFAALLEAFNLIEKTLSDENPQNRAEHIAKLETLKEEIDYEFLKKEIPVAIERSQRGIERVSDIVNAMKVFAHPSGKKKAYADINEGVKVTVAISKNEWKYAANLTTDLRENLPNAYCSLDEINQVVLNMIVNAAHSIEEKRGKNPTNKGSIHIETGEIGKSIFIRITDDGKGIANKDRDKIFDPFFTTKDPGKGTGQGLAISHDVIVEKHGGSISVKSEPGEGAEFTVTLPIDALKGGINER